MPRPADRALPRGSAASATAVLVAVALCSAAAPARLEGANAKGKGRSPAPSSGGWGAALDKEFKSLDAQGYSVHHKASTRSGQAELVAVAYRERAAQGFGKLRVYELRGAKARLVHIEAASAAVIDLDPVHKNGSWPDLYGDGSRWLLYTTEFPAMGHKTLRILRLSAGTLKPVHEPLPFGRLQDLDKDGRPEFISRSLPLGTFFAVECEDFRSMAQTAFQTSIWEWDGLALARASRKHAPFLEDNIARLEAELAANDPRKTERYGDFLGTALSIYFDHAEMGRGQEGWRRFAGIFRSRMKHLPPVPRVRRCMEKLREDVRGRLEIPADWPD